MIQYEKSALPKLLARENITVQHGNYPTAWFDVKDRVLGLPLWKDKGKDVYDLLIGHEVGHAIETPFEGWHDSPEKLEGCPRSYLNVVEDARIERKILARYPGLVSSFTKGYKTLFTENFFGDTQSLDYDQVKLIDKINLKTKLRTLIDVPFNAEEKVFYERSLKTETFDDVVNLVKDILAYTKENTPELISPPPVPEDDQGPTGEQNEDDFNMGHDDYESPVSDDEEGSSSKEETESSSQEDDSSETSDTDGADDADADNEELQEGTPTPKVQPDEDESETDAAFRQAESNMVEDLDEDGIGYSKPLTKEDVSHAVYTYQELKAARDKKASDSWYTDEDNKWNSEEKQAEFDLYFKKVKKDVANACREFEQRKAAFQYQRATVAKTGAINVNALWSYKTNEDIFLRATKLANAKSHGMMMLVDYSGSMHQSMRYVLDQVIHTAMFCKGVNIPFDVYAFTTGNNRAHSQVIPRHVKYDMPEDEQKLYEQKQFGRVEMDNLSMPQLLSSSLKKADFYEAVYWLWLRANNPASYYGGSMPVPRCEEYGSTPLNQALIVSHDLIKTFINKHKIEKMNFVTFSDGDANGFNAVGNCYCPKTWNVNIQGKVMKTSGNRREMTSSILKNLAKRYNTNNIGFFMTAGGHEWRYRIQDALWEKHEVIDTHEEMKAINKEYRKNKCVEFADILGYSKYYFVKGGKNLDTAADEFNVDEDMSKGQITTAFKKFSKSKKNNKVLMRKFAQEVA